jgi:hypothetical protein
MNAMTVYVSAVPVISIITGILVLAAPKFLRYIIGIYLVLVGILGLI